MNGVTFNSKDKGEDAVFMTDQRYQRFDREQLVRLLMQTALDLGLKDTASQMRNETGIAVRSPIVEELLELVLQGRWEDVVERCKMSVNYRNSDGKKEALFCIYEHEIFEALLDGDRMQALLLFRQKLVMLDLHHERTENLGQVILLPEDKIIAFIPFKEKSVGRNALKCQLEELIDPEYLVPSGRMAKLLDQALAYQASQCLSHNVLLESSDLLQDHSSPKSGLPTISFKVLRDHSDEVWRVRFSPNGRYCATAGKEGSIYLYDGTSFDLVRKIEGHRAAITHLSWSANSQFIITCSDDEDKKCAVWDVELGALSFVLNDHRVPPSSSAWHESNLIATGGPDKCIHLRNNDGTVCHTWQGMIPVDLQFVPHKNELAAVCFDKKLYIFNTETKEQRMIQESHNATCLSISKDGQYALLNLSNETIHLWRLSDQTLVHKYSGHKQGKFQVSSCFGGIDETFIASGSEDSMIYIWHRATQTLVAKIKGHENIVNDVDWHPTNPGILVSVSDDCTVRVWKSEATSPTPSSSSS